MLSRFERFIYDITEIDLYWHRLASAEMKEYGLKGNYTIYFTKLFRHPEGLTAAHLASVCGKDKADVSRDIAALERAGFVTRERTGSSTYRAQILLTPKGQQLTTKIIHKAELAVSYVGQTLTDADRDCFYHALDEITIHLQKLSETGLPALQDETKEYTE